MNRPCPLPPPAIRIATCELGVRPPRPSLSAFRFASSAFALPFPPKMLPRNALAAGEMFVPPPVVSVANFGFEDEVSDGRWLPGRRLERDPAVAGEVHLDPGVRVAVVHEVGVRALQLARREPDRNPGGDAVEAQDERHRAGEHLAIAPVREEHEVGEGRHLPRQVRRERVPERVGTEVVLEHDRRLVLVLGLIGARVAPRLVRRLDERRAERMQPLGERLRKRRNRHVADDDAVPDGPRELRAVAGELAQRGLRVVDGHRVLGVPGEILERRHGAVGVQQRLDAVRDRPPDGLAGADEVIVGQAEHLHVHRVELRREPGPRGQLAERLRQRPAVRRAHDLALRGELPVIDQEGVERGRLPVHLFLRGDLEHLRALLGPAQCRVGLVPHVVHTHLRTVVRERVPGLPRQERALRHARRRADDQPGEDDGHAQPDHLRVARERAAVALGGGHQGEQREHQEHACPEGVGVQREHRARHGEEAERDTDRRQGGAAAHDQPDDGGGGDEEHEPQVVVRAREAAGVDRRVRREPVAQAVHDQLRDAHRVDAVLRLPRPRVGDRADGRDRRDDERQQDGAAAAPEQRRQCRQRGQQRQDEQPAAAHVRLLEPGPVPAAEQEQRPGEDGGRAARAGQAIHAPPPVAGREPRAPGRRGRRRGSGRRRRRSA